MVSQFEQVKKKAQEEELQIAETKMVMHQVETLDALFTTLFEHILLYYLLM
jgi:hypothetical protein